jgi:hypothetical protein
MYSSVKVLPDPVAKVSQTAMPALQQTKHSADYYFVKKNTSRLQHQVAGPQHRNNAPASAPCPISPMFRIFTRHPNQLWLQEF